MPFLSPKRAKISTRTSLESVLFWGQIYKAIITQVTWVWRYPKYLGNYRRKVISSLYWQLYLWVSPLAVIQLRAAFHFTLCLYRPCQRRWHSKGGGGADFVFNCLYKYSSSLACSLGRSDKISSAHLYIEGKAFWTGRILGDRKEMERWRGRMNRDLQNCRD